MSTLRSAVIGLDRWVLPKLGTPWQHEVAIHPSEATPNP